MNGLNANRGVNALMAMFGALALWIALGCSATSTSAQGANATNQGTEQTASAEEPECKMGSNGQNVCGYHCKMGSNGRVYCADTPDGRCEMNSDGSYSCTQLAHTRGAVAASDVETECKLQPDGRKVCGYNCRLGSNGRAYCSSIPNGKCSLNSDGSFSCP